MAALTNRTPHTHGGDAPSRERGFSLTEVLVVLVIFSMAFVVAMPNFQRQRVIGAAINSLREIEGVHRFARLEALRRHSQVGIAFSSTARTVTVFEDRNRADDAAAGNENGQLDNGEDVLRRLTVGRALEYSRPDTGSTVDVGGATLLYRSDGSLRPAGVTIPAVYLADSKLNYFRIRINSITGGARTEKWIDGGRWSKRTEDWSWNY